MAAEKESSAGRLKTSIEAEILSGRLLPGERLDEQVLAARFVVSRTPVREALMQLSSAGLVQIRPRQGAFVARLSIRQIVAMAEFLTELESLAAEYAARRMTPEERRQLRQIWDESAACVASLEVERYAECNRCFHEAIYAGSRNEYLAQQLITIRARIRLYQRYPFQQPGEIANSFAEHGRIVEAIHEGMADQVRAQMRAHLLRGSHFFADMVATLPDALDTDGTDAA